MQHLHFVEISSTQNYLKDELEKLQSVDRKILVSAELQNQGIGRNQNKWIDSFGSVAFSFVLPISENPSLIPLWVGLKLKQFFELNYSTSIQLKWPNDIYVNSKKCGGIICHLVNEQVIIGIGLNLFATPNSLDDDRNLAGHLGIGENILPSDFKKKIPLEIYHYFSSQEYDAEKISKQFEENCLYLNEIVQVTEDSKSITGRFKEIGKWGELIIENQENGLLQNIFNGSIRKV